MQPGAADDEAPARIRGSSKKDLAKGMGTNMRGLERYLAADFEDPSSFARPARKQRKRRYRPVYRV